MKRTLTCLGSLLTAGLTCLTAAAAPTIGNVPIRGLQLGATTTLTIDGSQLDGNPQVLFSFPVAKAEIKPGATANQIQVDVTLDKQAPPGLYQVRVASAHGVSNPAVIAVDGLPQVAFAAEAAALPVAMHGALAGATVMSTTFQGAAGQRVVIDLECRRLGGATDPVLLLSKPDGSQLAYSPAQRILGGDARLDVALPVDGKYTIKFHDALFRGGSPGMFRLKIGQLAYADLVYPLGATRGQTTALAFASTNLPRDARVETTFADLLETQPANWPEDALVSGGRPKVAVSDLPETIEAAESPGTPQEIAVPAGISGVLAKSGEQDRYALKVQPGMKLRFDVLSNRLGIPLDGVLTVAREDGAQLAANDDRPNTLDPGLDFAVPGDVQKLIVTFSDRQNRGGADALYRISVTKADLPDFRLSVPADAIQVPGRGTTLVRVKAERAGYGGDIKLAFDPSPPQGVSLAGDVIPAGANETFLTITAGDIPPSAVLTRLVGDAAADGAAIRRLATAPENNASKHQPWLKRELALAVKSAEPLQIAWQPAEGAAFNLGQNFAVPVKVTRAEGAAGDVRLTLLTTQVVPPIAEGNDKGKPNLAKAVRLDGTPSIPATQGEGSVNVVVPADLPVMPYDLVLQAELLGPDGKQVLATAVTAALRVVPVKPAG
ncbi:MAG: hypothetical protein HYS13_24740 [Planctomycetia bacterium]|nr:hypothetical protein [Planctomycetia bacterium]